MFLTMTNACLIQRVVLHVEDYPEVFTGGFLWFKDLSMVDPFYILPLINLFLQVFSIYVY
jgi:membrane protein insertase Oxa1/YidC/SpoIIIJ